MYTAIVCNALLLLVPGLALIEPDVFANVIDTTVAQEIEGPINQVPTTNEE